MASSFNNLLNVEEIGTGEQAGSWGVTTNTNLATTLSEAITGRATVTILAPTGPLTLTYTNSNASQGVRNLVLDVRSSGNLTGTSDVIVPNRNKQYIVENNTTGTPTNQSIRVKTSAGTGVTIPPGKTAHVFCDGTNVRFADDFVGITGGTISGATISALSSALGVTSGGTGLQTATQGDIIYASASNTYAALPKDTNATRYLANTGTSNNPAWAQINLTNGVTGELPVNRGGTGLNTVTAGALLLGAGTSAFTTLTGTVTGQVVSWNNSTATWEAGTLASGVSSFSAGTTGLTPSTGTTGAVTLAGELSASNGGTGRSSLTANNVLIGNGTSAVDFVAPSTSGNALVSNGTSWASGNPARLSTASGSAPSYSARAWVNFNGTNAFSPNPSTSAIRASGNVSSITDNGVGTYTINFTTAMADVNYSAVFGGGSNDANITAIYERAFVTRTTSSIQVTTVNTALQSTFDSDSVNVVIFR